MYHALSRRRLIGLFVATAGGLLLASCAPAAAPTPTPAPAKPAEAPKPAVQPKAAPTPTPAAQPAAKTEGQVVELQMAFTWEAAFQPVQEEFNKKFMERHPNIRIKSTYNTWADHNRIVPTWAAAKTLPDVIYVHGAYIQPWIKLGAFRSLEPYLKQDREFDFPNDFWPEPLKLYRYKGEHYAIPYDHGPLILGYNKKIFDEAKIPYPKDTMTFEELLDLAKRLTKPGQQWGFQGLPISPNVFLITWTGGWGGEVIKVENDVEVGTLINDPRNIEALEWWAAMLHKHKVAPTPAEMQAIQGGPWLAGRVAMATTASWNTPTYNKFGAFGKGNWDVVPWPKGPARQITGSFGSGFGITRDSKYPDAAWTYLREYLSKEGQEFMWGRTGRGSVSRKSAYQSWMDSPEAPPSVKYFKEAMEKYAVIGRPISAVANRVIDIINREIDQVMNGQKSAKDAVAEIQRQADPILAENLKE